MLLVVFYIDLTLLKILHYEGQLVADGGSVLL